MAEVSFPKLGAVSIVSEIDLLRQQMYDLKQEIELLKKN